MLPVIMHSFHSLNMTPANLHTALHTLARLFNLGLKYRPYTDIPLADDYKDELNHRFSKSLRKCLKPLEQLLRCGADVLVEFCDTTCELFSEYVTNIGETTFLEWIRARRPHHPVLQFPDEARTLTLDDNALKVLTHLKKFFVFTYLDKCSRNFVCYCRKFYVPSLFNDIARNADTFVELSSESRDFRLGLFHEKTAHLRLWPGTAAIPPQLPFYAALLKAHKVPYNMRFLTCSSNVFCTPVGLFLNKFFTTFRSYLDTIWNDQFSTAKGFPFDNFHHWVCFSSAESMENL